MKTFVFTNETNDEKYEKELENLQEAYHWFVNHLDLSLKWNIIEKKHEEDPIKKIKFFWGTWGDEEVSKV